MEKQRHVFHPPQKGESKFTTFLAIITIIFIIFVGYKNLDNITEILIGKSNLNTENTGNLQIGQEVNIEGTIISKGDYINYTHQLITQSDGNFGLKSKTIDLNQYTGTISIEGIVEKNIDNLYIINVNNVVGNMLISSEITGDTENKSNGIYLENAGIFFPENFFTNYTLLNSGENGTIKIKKTENNKEIHIQYFTCKKNNPNENCKELLDSYSSNKEKSLITSNGDEFIKMADTNSRFFTNTLYGYIINDVPVQEVETLSEYIIIPNKNFINNTILPKIENICVDGDKVINQIDNKNSLSLENGKIIAKFTGKINSGTAECKIAINPSLTYGGEKIALYYNENTSSNTNTIMQNNQSTNFTIPSEIKQFPINLEKTLTYTSSRGGYSIIFPSANIAYSASSIQTNLNIQGVNCFTQINVIKYSEKANLETSPAIKIYECRTKSTIQIPTTYLQKKLEDGRTFLIEIIDQARIDFANNIGIQ